MTAQDNIPTRAKCEPEDTHDASLADGGEGNTSIAEDNNIERQENSRILQDATTSREEVPGMLHHEFPAMLPQEAREPRVDDPVMRYRFIPFPSQRSNMSSQNSQDYFPQGHFHDPDPLENTFDNSLPTGPPTQPAERPTPRNNTTVASSWPAPAIAPAAAPTAARTSMRNSYHRRGGEGSRFPPPPTCLAYSSSARVLSRNHPYFRPTPPMFNHHQPSAAGTGAAVSTSTDHAMQGGQASLFNARRDFISTLIRERDDLRKTYEANRVSRPRKKGGIGASRDRSRLVDSRFRRLFAQMDACFGDLVRANRANRGCRPCQDTETQNIALREAQRYLHQCIAERRAAEVGAQQQGEEDADEGPHPASTTGDEADQEQFSEEE
ncbi:unnamed protein product [Clonostachys solani]|uniref:Uncharacterized protein n=1 Tax=Clonostachys solani TaxID=160281 RepID=A0A9N9YZN4_9HYPO|nr:unnamed protein product [Clonostachys solani]